MEKNLEEDSLITRLPFWKKMDASSLELNGVRYRDVLLIKPMQGKSKKIVLNRTQFSFFPSNNFDTEVKGFNIFLPNLMGDKVSFSLSLTPVFLKSSEKGGRYLLNSYSGSPFKINGVLSYSSFIERGDVVDLGFHRLEFKPPTEECLNSKENDLLQNPSILNSNLNILIEGETGTGKSRLAKIIHEKSNRKGEFVQINLASYSEGLIESELFGHIKGAFTGAFGTKQGAFLFADKGTLFLDEIDSLPINIQTKLLLFLDTNEFRQVGGEKLRKTDVRIIFASGKSLKDLVHKGKMRQDFFYRISSGVKLQLPPLREDLSLLERICRDFSLKEGIYIHPSLQDYYKKLFWPGNIRQLISHLKKKKLLSKGNKIEFDSIDEDLVDHEKDFFRADLSRKPHLTLEEVKKRYAYNVFKYCRENLDEASRVLDISKNTLRNFVRSIKALC
ncbi:MAG: hypothetical protein CME68_07110 [Halobacteriovoraceae bacterium]|nr:hypothetical protein [Halobacteriovoraceae bacterium]